MKRCKSCKKIIRGEGGVLRSFSIVGKPIVSHLCKKCASDPSKVEDLRRKHDRLLDVQDQLFPLDEK